MTKQEIQDYSDKITRSLEQKKGKQVFDLLHPLLAKLQNWQLHEQLQSLEETYQTMLHYLAEGMQDPSREKVYAGLIRSLYQITDTAIFQIKTANDNALFYERKRAYRLYVQETTAQLIAELEDKTGQMALLSLADGEEHIPKWKELDLQKELLVRKLFYNVWVSDPWTNDEKNHWSSLLSTPPDAEHLPSLIVTGLTLNLLEVFDEKKAMLLLEAIQNANDEVRERALTGTVLFLRKYDYRLPAYPAICEHIRQLADDPKCIRKIRHILLQFILSRETEKITRKINSELLPELMKKMGSKGNIQTKLMDWMADTGLDEKNPEWQTIIEQSGLEDQFREISELQLEGADVMHSSFIHLKNYPFFNEPSNWFLPFTIPGGGIEDKLLARLAKVLENSTLLCNSDKYSFYLSVSQMPEMYRKRVIEQFSAESDALREIREEELPDASKTIDFRARQYIQDLYRFYKLHPRRNDFEDIFDRQPEFYQVPSINRLMEDQESLSIIGEYYFNKNYFEEANDIFDRLLQTDSNNDVLYQKKGYCLQILGKLEEALDAYQKAELLNANHSWTIKKLAHLHRILKHTKDALLYYKKAEQLNPDNLSIQLSIGHCYLELKEYEQALKYYFKVEYLTRNKEKAWRAIAWTSFRMGKYPQAEDYFHKLIESAPHFTDYLKAGHVQLASGRTKEAIRLYQSALEAGKQSPEEFAAAFAGDIPDLVEAGVAQENIPFILDCVFYGFRK
ncbi:MAG: tetratricopeptide repeat protein [Dysgonamonadaceae bacterium]|jgi:tetratricopeptide (TPR) repeat protein|nr:tetratricopeptide repeat protein [Dysgonamonadaceae bacterium]